VLFWAPLCVLSMLSSASAATGEDQALRELMVRMQQSPGVVAEFVEEKRISMLTEPLRSRGRIYFAPPGELLRVTDAPSETRMLLSGDEVRYRDEAGADRFDLSANAMARQFVENFIVLFTGDLEQLRARYEITAKIEGEDWALDLRPRRAPFDRLVARVSLQGHGRLLASIEMLEKDGDSTFTRIVEMDPDRSLTADDLGRMFAD
jgi:outer membrane lipoprotein-sorting protein